jgi:hypothetical protein
MSGTAEFEGEIPAGDIGTVPRWVRRLGRLFRRKDFEPPAPEFLAKSKYSDLLFSILFHDEKLGRRIDDATVQNLRFLVHRSLAKEERGRAETYVAQLVGHWKRNQWIKYGESAETLVLTRDGTEHITRLTFGWRGGYLVGDSPLTSRGKVQIVRIVCGTIVLVALIAACTIVALGWISIVGDLVKGFKELVDIATGLWSVFKSIFSK